MSEDVLRILLDKYVTGSLSENERSALSQLLDDESQRIFLEKILLEEFQAKRFEGEDHSLVLGKIEEHVLKTIAVPERKIHSLFRWVAAASVLAFITVTCYLFTRNYKQSVQDIAQHKEGNVISPGGNKARLTLSNGSTILLNSMDTGTIAEQGNTKIIKTDSGKLFYAANGENESANSMNTLTTPRGGVFQLTLPDGTKAWLNASSSITYPTAFNNKQRTVSVTGEVYFDVAKNSRKPFRVQVNDMSIDVLGTEFNVNAYANEQVVKTTLLNGSVKVTGAKQALMIEPGEQAQYNKNKLVAAKNEDIEQVVAWKNGYFNFKNADLPTVMRQLERWYNIDVQYEGEMPQRRFQGELPRNLELSAILKVLTDMNIKYTLNERTLLITK